MKNWQVLAILWQFAPTVFDCRMANDPAMMSSAIPARLQLHIPGLL
jgi:hypothetical protein